LFDFYKTHFTITFFELEMSNHRIWKYPQIVYQIFRPVTR
jgi:hypothetical protein